MAVAVNPVGMQDFDTSKPHKKPCCCLCVKKNAIICSVTTVLLLLVIVLVLIYAILPGIVTGVILRQDHDAYVLGGWLLLH